jgi:hypothetical protein
MKNLSIGTGLAILGLCVVSPTILDRIAPSAHAGTTATSAAIAAATAQVPPEPTIVWYGTSSSAAGTGYQIMAVVFRAWSDGKIEFKQMLPGTNNCASSVCPNWQVLSDPNSGYNASADINFDSKVDGADLGKVLAMWGDAPRHDIPPSTCPLNLINP